VAQFVAEGEAIIRELQGLDPNQQRRRVRIARLRGMEDSSREWSPLMVVEHLMMTGPGMLGAAQSLAAGRVPGEKPGTARVKPRGEVGPEILERYAAFLHGYPAAVAALTLRAEPKFEHPWFGPLDARRWIVLNTFHQALHGRQLGEIRSMLGR